MSIITELKWEQLLNRTYFRVCRGAIARIGRNVKFHNCHIIINSGSQLEIGNNSTIENTFISIVNGKCVLREHCIIGNKKNHTMLNIESGTIYIGHHTKINAKRFWVRFGGEVHIGNYTNINSGSEIRCDNSISIGSYNQISYNVNIWDTNTHNIMPIEERRELAKKYFPYYGKELACPKTSPIIIGNDCWLGQNVSILKGTTIENGVVVGYNCMLSGNIIQANSTVVSVIQLKIKRNENDTENIPINL